MFVCQRECFSRWGEMQGGGIDARKEGVTGIIDITEFFTFGLIITKQRHYSTST